MWSIKAHSPKGYRSAYSPHIGWVAIETYGKAKQEWLSSFLELPNGIPSHDTFGRVFSALDPEILEHNFLSLDKSYGKRVRARSSRHRWQKS